MSNVSIKDRSVFEKEFFINHIQDDYEEVSSDGTIKTKFKLHDGKFVEGVLIPKDKRMTAVILLSLGIKTPSTNFPSWSLNFVFIVPSELTSS